jgi:phosphomannomutase/phosphoglucomutase
MLQGKDVFRKYDIRGVYGQNLTSETAQNAARAFATQVYAETGGKKPLISVGRDVRFSSGDLFNAVCRGLTESGADVIDIGVNPSPLTYFSMYHHNTDGYVMITGSHNPPEFNGIKLGTKNTVFHSERIEQIYTDIINGNFPQGRPAGAVTQTDVRTAYIDFMTDHFQDLTRMIKSIGRPIRIVIDAGSGTASHIAPAIFEKLGVEVIPLYCKPDGSFPGHHPDPTVEANLAEARKVLLKNSADLCVAFDGDADRLGALDCDGNMIWGDQLLGIFACAIAGRHQGETLVADVKASRGLYELVKSIGMKPVMYYSGHSMIKEKMKMENAVIGGEMSSHFFFADRYYGYDDGIYAALRLLEAYVNSLASGKITHSSQLLDNFPKYFNTPEIREFCPDEKKFELVENLKNFFLDCQRNGRYGIQDIIDIDGLRINFEKGWALVRASNTEPLLVTRYEAVTPEDLTDIRCIVERSIKGA